MSNVLVFPAFRHEPPDQPAALEVATPSGLAATHGRRGEYALGDIARYLRLNHFGVRTIVEKLRALAEHDGMPLPRTPRVVKGEPKRGPMVIYSKSRWDAGEFDAWIVGGRGPTGAPAQARPLAPPIFDEMGRRADSIGQAATA